ncbi:MAG: type VI secretion system lipoprotein TssJ [Litoreibacter sp.]
MLIDRRLFVIGSTTTLALSGCLGGPKATVLSVKAQGAAGMNTGPDGNDRPVTVTILQLRSATGFDSADYFSLQNPSATLGTDLIKSNQLVLAPQGSANLAIPIEADATVIGIVAGFRDPAGKQFRNKIGAPGSSAGLTINVSSGGVQSQLI